MDVLRGGDMRGASARGAECDCDGRRGVPNGGRAMIAAQDALLQREQSMRRGAPQPLLSGC